MSAKSAADAFQELAETQAEIAEFVERKGDRIVGELEKINQKLKLVDQRIASIGRMILWGLILVPIVFPILGALGNVILSLILAKLRSEPG